MAGSEPPGSTAATSATSVRVPSGGPPAVPPEAIASPRAEFAAELAAHVARLLAAGDLEGARIAHEAMGRLLVAPLERTAEVVYLDTERRRRTER